jgi:hypothetical protein
MPKKSEEEIYKLVIEWYEYNYLIDKDDWSEHKQFIKDPDQYAKRI